MRIKKEVFINFDNILFAHVFKEKLFIIGSGGLEDRLLIIFGETKFFTDTKNPLVGLSGIVSIRVVYDTETGYYYSDSIFEVSNLHFSNSVLLSLGLDFRGFIDSSIRTLPKFYLYNLSNIVDLEAQGYDVEIERNEAEIESVMNNLFIDMRKTSLYISHLPLELKYRLVDEMNLYGLLPKSIVAELKSYDADLWIKVSSEGI